VIWIGFLIKKACMQTILIAFMSGLFGWILIWLLAKSLLNPTNPLSFLGFKWEPAIHTFISHFPFESFAPTPNEDAYHAILPLIDEKLDHFFDKTIKEKLPMISMFIGDKTVVQLKAVFLEELASLFPQIIQQFSENAKKEMTRTLASKLILVLKPIVMKSIKPLQWMAFVIGFIWGLMTVYLINHI
jgi:hypothetical protein